MTDDIATRLRDIASLRGNLSGSVIPIACTEAADEIERLRVEVARLGSFLHPIGTVINGHSGSQATTAWIGSDGTITNHDPNTEMGFWVRLFHNECDRSAHLEREIERLRGLMVTFVYEWERWQLGENNGSEYFTAVHAMRKAVRGE